MTTTDENPPEHIGDTIDSLKSNLPEKPSGRGGARPGAGRPSGRQDDKVIERNEALKKFRERVARNTDRLLNAQMDKALGEKYLMVVRTIGKGAKARRETSIVTDVEKIKEYFDNEESLSTDTEYHFMTVKPADNKALDSLMDRTYGKSAQSIDVTSGGEKVEGAIVGYVLPRPTDTKE